MTDDKMVQRMDPQMGLKKAVQKDKTLDPQRGTMKEYRRVDQSAFLKEKSMEQTTVPQRDKQMVRRMENKKDQTMASQMEYQTEYQMEQTWVSLKVRQLARTKGLNWVLQKDF